MIDGKMQDDATWKQAKVLVDLARTGRRQGPGDGGAYGFDRAGAWQAAICHRRKMTHGQRRSAKYPDRPECANTSASLGIVSVPRRRVRHRPEFNNTEEWYQSIPAEVRPRKDQPFYHLFAENAETEYIAYVSEQNLLPDTSGEPVRHPQVAEVFEQDEKGSYRPRNSMLN